jgi:predicted nucleic acid-binding Zn ribbon protein
VRRPPRPGPRPLSTSLPRLLGRLGAPPPDVFDALFTRWEDIAGTELSRHARPLRVDGPCLVVMVDHPSWATRARMASPRIVAAVNEIGGGSVERLDVLVERA